MSQSSVTMPTAGIVSGLTLVTDLNAALDSIRTAWSGASAPSADVAEEGQWWLDTSVANYATLRMYDGTSWISIFTFNTSTHAFVPSPAAVRTTVADANYVATIYDRNIAFTSLTASRTVTLPAVNTYPAGIELCIWDETGSLTGGLAITLIPNVANNDVVKACPGMPSSIAMPYGFLKLKANGANPGQWTVVGAQQIPTIPGAGGI